MDPLTQLREQRALYLVPEEKSSGDPLAATTWEEFHGQATVKRNLSMFIESARKRGERLDHVLLAAPPGLGKTTLAAIIAAKMGSQLVQCQLPMDGQNIIRLIEGLSNKDILFLDEAHLIGQRKGAVDMLLPVLMTGRTLSGRNLPNVTIVAATTDKDQLPQSFLSRFPIKPYFEPYTNAQMREIIKSMAGKLEVSLEPALVYSLARASSNPRVAGNLVRHARVLVDNGEDLTSEKVLRFAGLTPDGLCREQISYVTTLYRNPKYVGGETVYRMGFNTLVNTMREPKESVVRLEKLLVDLGYIQHEATGRSLTDKGIALAKRHA